MDYERFLTLVEQDLRIGRERAERAVRATLQTLSERISAGQARDLAEQLPAELAPWLATTGASEPFHVDEFLRRVAEREDTDVPTAERHAKAVFAALGQAISADELDDVASELPREYAPLLPRGPRIDVTTADTFLRAVADRAGLRADDARRATEAVLETLGERIAGGEVEDLISWLPVQLHAPLRRGMERSGGKAKRMSLDEFVWRVAERERVSSDQAREHVRAVLVTLREAVGEKEFSDVTAQLPGEFVGELVRS